MEKLEKFGSIFQSKKVLLFLLIIFSFGLVIILQQVGKAQEDDSIIFTKHQIVKTVFGNLSLAEIGSIENIVREQIRLIVAKPAFPNSLAVAKKYQNKIRQFSTNRKFPQDLALGVALLENGGSEVAISSAGAAGIFQLTTPTAKTLGLKVEKDLDERLDPEKNIEAGISYLDQNLEIFGNPGLAVWAHHAGTQNVSRALKIYLESIGEADAYDFVEAVNLGKLDRAKYVWRAYVTKDNLNIHKLLSTPALTPFLSGLSDETELYPYKVVAAAILFDASQNFSNDTEFFEKVKLFNQGRILLSELVQPD